MENINLEIIWLQLSLGPITSSCCCPKVLLKKKLVYRVSVNVEYWCKSLLFISVVGDFNDHSLSKPVAL